MAQCPLVLSVGEQKRRVLLLIISVLSLEDLALVEGFTHMLEVSLPGKVLFYHGFALFTVWIQLAPVI